MGGLIQGMATAGMGIWQAHEDANAAHEEYAATSRMLTYQERRATLKGKQEAGELRSQGSAVADAQFNAYAAAGIDPTSGTAAAVQADTAAQAELDAQTRENNAALEVWGYRTQKDQAAKNLQTRLKTIDRQAIGSVLTGAGQMIGGAGGIMKKQGS